MITSDLAKKMAYLSLKKPMIAEASIDFQRLADTVEKHKKRSLLLRSETIAVRKKRLKGFDGFLMENRDRIAEAVSKDFKKPKTESDVSELYPVLTEKIDRE